MNTLDVKQFADYGVATVYEAAGRVGLIDVPLYLDFSRCFDYVSL
jgi:hypothetical protein